MFKRLSKTLLMVFALAALTAFPVSAEKDPYMQPNNTWIRLSGTVDAVSANAFTLDYGDGIVTVEMDDGDRDADGYKLLKGDKVAVFGFIDDDTYETTSIEASSVYVENLGTYFYASSLDEEDYDLISFTSPVVPAETFVQGKVTAVAEDEFTIDSGLRLLTVEVDEMLYNPLDDEGYQKIEVGDRVNVRGHMDRDFFEGRVLEAESVIELPS